MKSTMRASPGFSVPRSPLAPAKLNTSERRVLVVAEPVTLSVKALLGYR